jgi:hypothetical protein
MSRTKGSIARDVSDFTQLCAERSASGREIPSFACGAWCSAPTYAPVHLTVSDKVAVEKLQSHVRSELRVGELEYKSPFETQMQFGVCGCT